MFTSVRSGLAQPGQITKQLRYCAVTVVSTATGLSILGILVGALGVNAVLANVIATAVGTVPSFELNRRWVWANNGRRSMARQVVPFCSLSFAGLVLSTLVVRVASSHTVDWTRAWHTLAVESANLSAYGALWVVQFVVLDRVLFRRPLTRFGSADLPDPVGASPGGVGRPYLGVQAIPECEAEPVGQGESFAANPSLGRPLGVGRRHRLDFEVVGSQQ
jgi:putative flippase GtrA